MEIIKYAIKDLTRVDPAYDMHIDTDDLKYIKRSLEGLLAVARMHNDRSIIGAAIRIDELIKRISPAIDAPTIDAFVVLYNTDIMYILIALDLMTLTYDSLKDDANVKGVLEKIDGIRDLLSSKVSNGRV